MGVPFEECPRCAYDRATCERKIRLAGWAEADEWANEYNADRGWKPPLMARYPCRWCEGWHMNTARDKRDRVRAARLRRARVGAVDERDEEAFQYWVRTGKVLAVESDTPGSL